MLHTLSFREYNDRKHVTTSHLLSHYNAYFYLEHFLHIMRIQLIAGCSYYLPSIRAPLSMPLYLDIFLFFWQNSYRTISIEYTVSHYCRLPLQVIVPWANVCGVFETHILNLYWKGRWMVIMKWLSRSGWLANQNIFVSCFNKTKIDGNLKQVYSK